MDNLFSQGFVPDEPVWTAPLPTSARAGSVHGRAETEGRQGLEEGFPWLRIRRLPKKG